MDIRELPSDSDESDVDFVPGGAESDVVSEADSDEAVAEEASEASDEGNSKQGKRPANRKSKKRTRKQASAKVKRAKNQSPTKEDENEDDEEKKAISKEEADAIYKKFLEEPAPKPKTSENTKEKESEEKTQVTEVYEFAGEKVTVTKDVPSKSSTLETDSPVRGRGRARGRGGRGGVTSGLSAILGQIGKKNKLGTLEKSKLDWDQFKKKEGISNELKTHNRGKEGFLERQDFLERADLRQYDLERNARKGARRSNT